MSITASQIKTFKIFAGPERGSALVGFLQRGDRTRLSTDTEAIEVNNFDGNVLFPNLFNAWGRRIAEGKDGVNCDANDSNYKGEIEFLSWGDEKGNLIQCRYMAGHKTLDYNYQVQRLGLPKHNTSEGAPHNWIVIPMGENEITPNDPAYSALIKIHPMNKDSICRSPNVHVYQWHEVKEMDAVKEKVTDIDFEWDAINIVKSSASSGKKMNILFDLIGGDSVIVYDKSDEGSKFEGMKVYAKENPKKVLDAVNQFKQDVQSSISKAESFEAFDLSVKGVIKVKKNDSKVVLISDVPASGKNMLQWLYENCMEPNVFAAYGKLKSYCDNNFK
jgi:hypothetical protein